MVERVGPENLVLSDGILGEKKPGVWRLKNAAGTAASAANTTTRTDHGHS